MPCNPAFTIRGIVFAIGHIYHRVHIAGTFHDWVIPTLVFAGRRASQHAKLRETPMSNIDQTAALPNPGSVFRLFLPEHLPATLMLAGPSACPGRLHGSI